MAAPGGRASATVSYPAEPGFEDADAPCLALATMRIAALEHPLAAARLTQLMWTFSRAPLARHAKSSDVLSATTVRFLEWAVFVAAPDGRTLARIALDDMRDQLTPEEIDERERIIQPRISMYEVVSTEPDSGFEVQDLTRDRETLFVRDRLASSVMRPGSFIIGALHPQGDAWMLSPSAAAFPSTPTNLPSDLRGNPEELPILFEQVFHDISEDGSAGRHSVRSRRRGILCAMRWAKPVMRCQRSKRCVP